LSLDPEWIKKAANGNEEAFTQLVNQYKGYLMATDPAHCPGSRRSAGRAAGNLLADLPHSSQLSRRQP